jgi:hypothetical protein
MRSKKRKAGTYNEPQFAFANELVSKHFIKNFDALFDALADKNTFYKALAEQDAVCYPFDIVGRTGDILLKSYIDAQFGNSFQYCLEKKQLHQNITFEFMMDSDHISEQCFKKTKDYISDMLQDYVQKYYDKYKPLYIFASQNDVDGINGFVFLHKHHAIFITMFADTDADTENMHIDMNTKYIEKHVFVDRYMYRIASAEDKWQMIFSQKYLEAFHDAMLSHSKPRSNKDAFNIFEHLSQDEILQIFEKVKSKKIMNNKDMSDYIFKYMLKSN